MNKKYIFQKKWFLNACLFSIIIVLFFLNFYSKTLFLGPISLHQWRQSDCLSITKNYYEEGTHFFNPKIHSLRAPGGRAVSECPMINYSVALLWKIFGEHEFIYKLFEYFIYLVSIFILFNTLLKYYFSKAFIFFVVSLLLTSPLLVYYSFNFLSDVPALSFCIMAFCFLFSFYKTKLMRYFYSALLFGTLAVLLKASAVIALVLLSVFGIIDILNVNRRFGTEKSLMRKVLPAFLICSSFFVIYLWYKFARDYNSFGNTIFLLTITPIWEMPRGEILDNFKSLLDNLFPTFLNRPMLALFFSLVLYIIFYFKKLDVFLKYCFVFSGLFFVVYIVVFFGVFNVHDYYLINLFIFPVICFFCFLHINAQIQLKHSFYLNSFLVATFVLNAFYAAATYRLKLIRKDNMLEWYPFVSNEERRAYDYSLWDYQNSLEPIKKLQPKLREMGIKRDDVVLSLTDGGPDVALYLMDQKGYVITKDRLVDDRNSLKSLLPSKVKYLILNNKEFKETVGFREVESSFESIYKKSPVEVYKLK